MRIAGGRCGVQLIQDKIAGGRDAPLGSQPWMALLNGLSPSGNALWFCGGVLIHPSFVLTAAHCFHPRTEITLQFIRLGEHTLSSNPDCNNLQCAPQPQDLDAAAVISHEAYGNPCKQCNDIALIRLAQPAQLNTISVVPACLPVHPERDMGFPVGEFDGKVAMAAGWGSTSRDPLIFDLPDTLQVVNLPIQKLSYCTNLQLRYLEPTMIVCAGGSRQRDTCKGDSGGPLTLTNVFGTVTFVVGITSVGPMSCGSNNTQGLYTSVHYYVPWILQAMRR